jgi:hypothetical protein
MRMLVSMPHVGYVRHYEGTIRHLVDRGHSTHIAFALEDGLERTSPLERLLEHDPARVSWSLVQHDRTGTWSVLARGVRRLVDYQRYFDARYDAAPKLRSRATTGLPKKVVSAVRALPLDRPAVRRAFTSALKMVEAAIPVERTVRKLFEETRPDVVLVTPMVDFGSYQTEFVKAARALGIPVVISVFSWDNLTNKGLIRIHPDWVVTWNELQKSEAIELHGIDRGRVLVVGAACFDHWFEWRSSTMRGEFCRQLGLDPEKPLLLYTCSSYFIAPDEVHFVRRWIAFLREHAPSPLREASILVRPHPNNLAAWASADLSDLKNVAVWPISNGFPVDRESRSIFYDSIFHCAAVIGINTSAQIEAGIIGRPVLTIRSPEFAATQEGTLHFEHLVRAAGGLVYDAAGFEEHLEHLQRVLGDPTGAAEKSRSFVASFLRPGGIDEPVAPKLAACLEGIAERRDRLAHPPPRTAKLLRLLLYPVGKVLSVALGRSS